MALGPGIEPRSLNSLGQWPGLPDIGIMVRVFANSAGDWGPVPVRVIPKTRKMVHDAALLSTQHYKVSIKGKVEKSGEWSSALHYTSV